MVFKCGGSGEEGRHQEILCGLQKTQRCHQEGSYPLPRPQEMLHELGPAAYFSKFDLKAGYWQVMVDPADRHKTAFKTKDGLFESLVMPFGLTAAPATFQRLMDRVLGDLLWHGAMVYLDDIIVYSNTWEEHILLLDEIFTRLRAAGLKASQGKCEFAQTSMQYLGHVVTREGVLPVGNNIKAILDCPEPKTLTQVRSFVGMVQYYGDYVGWLADLAAPLFALYKKDVLFHWGPEQQEAFEAMKQALTTPPVLRRPDTSRPYIVQTDWSPIAIGAVLAQEDAAGEEHLIASRMLRGPELKYSASEGECFAVVHFIEHFRPYLYGTPFLLEMDHWALRWLMTGTQHNGRLARWALKLQEYGFKRSHQRGTQNSNADAMSRPPIAHDDEGKPRVAMLNVYETQPLEFPSNSETERTTYATERAQSRGEVTQASQCLRG